MIVISNSSPLIALSRVGRLNILREMFGKIHIPEAVYRETVLQGSYHSQKRDIQKAVDERFVIVGKPKTSRSFRRTIDLGERGVLNLAFDMKADILLIDDKKARNEAKELGFRIAKTSALLRRAEKMNLIASYDDILSELEKSGIYLPT
jgi:predicted nucleic acid-binding protein